MEKIVLLGFIIAIIALVAKMSDLRTLVRRSLLARRMAALDLDPYELALSDPALFRHLQRQCTLCESRKSCLQDLAHDYRGAAWRDRREWREYCPNASALDMLILLQSRSKTAPKYSFPYLG